MDNELCDDDEFFGIYSNEGGVKVLKEQRETGGDSL
jgi:hypothetical protein